MNIVSVMQCRNLLFVTVRKKSFAENFKSKTENQLLFITFMQTCMSITKISRTKMFNKALSKGTSMMTRDFKGRHFEKKIES